MLQCDRWCQRRERKLCIETKVQLRYFPLKSEKKRSVRLRFLHAKCWKLREAGFDHMFVEWVEFLKNKLKKIVADDEKDDANRVKSCLPFLWHLTPNCPVTSILKNHILSQSNSDDSHNPIIQKEKTRNKNSCRWMIVMPSDAVLTKGNTISHHHTWNHHTWNQPNQ